MSQGPSKQAQWRFFANYRDAVHRPERNSSIHTRKSFAFSRSCVASGSGAFAACSSHSAACFLSPAIVASAGMKCRSILFSLFRSLIDSQRFRLRASWGCIEPHTSEKGGAIACALRCRSRLEYRSSHPLYIHAHQPRRRLGILPSTRDCCLPFRLPDKVRSSRSEQPLAPLANLFLLRRHRAAEKSQPRQGR